MTTSTIRPICPHCNRLPRHAYRDRKGVMKFRPYCCGCYNAGVASLVIPTDRVILPKDLVDTGLRIHNEFQELIWPDGTVETPVPSWLRYPNFFFETAPKSRTILVVMASAKALDTRLLVG